ncbi:SixA phosphatase family protein [Nocardia harenae]|uniref:SixA phosphatase family protein n=1 Tax=Nocardia harenae TaxID=358707 RepID=UPI000837602A|nr:histidine phosphatase family protein [Nocardia harenae]
MARTLILLRHGKSAYPHGVADHERPLAPRGEREAALAGTWIRTTLPPVDEVRCSTAERTRSTLAATGITAPAHYESGIYGADAAELIELVRLTGDDVRTLLLVGHVPGMPETALELAADRTGAAALALARKFPTSALAVLEFELPWSGIGPGSGELTRFHVPR